MNILKRLSQQTSVSLVVDSIKMRSRHPMSMIRQILGDRMSAEGQCSRKLRCSCSVKTEAGYIGNGERLRRIAASILKVPRDDTREGGFAISRDQVNY